MAGWFRDPKSGAPVYMGDDGLVQLRNYDGQLHGVKPAEVGKLLGDELSGYAPASHQDLQAAEGQRKWAEADTATKADFYAREAIKGVADAATTVPRAAFSAGMSAAKALSGSDAQVSNPLEALSGERLVRKLDETVGGEGAAREEADRARQFSEAAPGGKFVANTAGFLAGGAALKGLGVAGEALAGTGLLGEGSALAKVGSGAIEGASQSYAAGAEDAWVRDEDFTTDAAMAHMGFGALLGGGLAGTVAAAGSAKNALAEKVFGAGKSSADGAISELAEDIVGQKPPAGFGQYLRDALGGARDKLETAQAAVSGVAKEDLQKYGGLRWTEEAIGAREALVNRPQILEAASTDLTESLGKMITESRKITDEVSRATGKKLENIKPLLTGDAETMMSAAREKAAGIQEALGKLDQVDARGRSLMGQGKHIEDIRAAMEDTVDKVAAAAEPAEAVHALDEFKARMQRAKMNADSSAQRLTSGAEINAARERSRFAEQVSEDMRGFLEQDVWGKFGAEQAKVNKAYTRALDADQYISSHLLERTGNDWATGRGKYVVDPRKVASFVEGLGTNKSKTLEGLLRENISARKDLAEAIVGGYGLAGHEETLRGVIESTTQAQKLMDHATDTIGKANIVAKMIETAKGGRETLGYAEKGAVLGGIPGALVGGAIDLVTKPDRLIHQAIAFREVAAKMGVKIDGSVKALVSGTAPISKAFAAVGKRAERAAPVARKAAVAFAVSERDQTKRYDRLTKEIVATAADPVAMADKISAAVGDVDHEGMRDKMIGSAVRSAQFLASKIPAPVYGDAPLRPSQLRAVAPAQKAQFLRYFDAVNDPAMVFDKIQNGTASPEHMEALKAVHPALYQRAQLAVFKAVTSNDHPIAYQSRLVLAELFDAPGLIEPTLKGDFMARISEAAAMGNVSEKQQQGAQPQPMPGNVSASMGSPLDSLRI